ncbi:MAG: hypothetical protein ISQ70_13810 [Pirellulales bacterium]|nr:hypothetical protein [Pirellulales bacterium]MBL7194452.1 hypothetical protein [Pirellulales bacterium]
MIFCTILKFTRRIGPPLEITKLQQNVLRSKASLFAALAFITLLSGCGPDPEGRVSVAGSVVFDGAALPSGTIEFHPVGDGSPIGGVIRDGAFEIPAIKGPKPGDYTVKIYATDEGGEPVVDPNAAPGDSNIPLPPELIPEKYNAQSELAATVGARGETDLAFDLQRQGLP